MKRLLSLMAAVLFVMAAWSQQEMARDSKVYVPAKKAGTRNATRGTISAQTGQMWWCNYDADEDAGWNFSSTSPAGHYSVATFIPYGLVGGSGTTVDGLSFFPISSGMANVKVWVSKNLTDGTYLETKSVTTTLEEFNDVKFNNSYEIPSDGLYVGYSFDITSKDADNYAYRALLYTNTENDREGAFWKQSPGNTSWQEQGGNLLVKVLFGGGNFLENAATPHHFGNHCVMKGNNISVPVKIDNKGSKPITSISYIIISLEGATEESVLNVNIDSQTSSLVSVPFKSDSNVGETNRTFIITKVNGVENESSMGAASGKLITISQNSPFLPVVEEFTATWCGYCPYGMVGMEKANEVYGDQVALIAVHSEDVMAIPAYGQILGEVKSFPSAKLNRVDDFYPYFYYINYYINNAKSKAVPGSIQAKASWTDKSQTAFKVDTETTFQFSTNDGHFAIAYVLVEDGLTGTGSSWAQSNYLSGKSGDSDMQFWYDSPSTVTGIKYNHVAVQGWDVLYGVNGSVSKTITAGSVQNYSFKGDISSNTLIQDKSKLKLIALLIDSETTKIINAAQTTIAPAETSATSVPITFQKSGKTTFVSSKDLNFSGRNDVKAFIATGYDVNTSEIWLARVEDAPAGTPLWVTGPANTTVDIPVGTSTTYYPQSLMYGSATATTPINASNDEYLNMTLSPGDGKTSKRTTAYDLPAGKAYLHLPLKVASNVGTAETVTLSAKGKLAYVSKYDLDFSGFGDDLKAYTAIGYAKSGDIWFARVMKASAGTPLYLKGAANGKYSIPSSEVKLTWVNMLCGSATSPSVVNMVDGKFTNFLLYKADGEWSPAQKDYPSLAAGTAFLSVPTAYLKASSRGDGEIVAGESEAEVMCISLNSLLGETTGIRAIEETESDDVWYNLNGQRIDKPAKKGLYIRNGKKVIVK